MITLWYRPPELLLGQTNYDASIDLWSVGCLLAELVVGRPMLPGRTEVEQLHRIYKLCGTPPDEYWDRLQGGQALVMRPPTTLPVGRPFTISFIIVLVVVVVAATIIYSIIIIRIRIIMITIIMIQS